VTQRIFYALQCVDVLLAGRATVIRLVALWCNSCTCSSRSRGHAKLLGHRGQVWLWLHITPAIYICWVSPSITAAGTAGLCASGYALPASLHAVRKSGLLVHYEREDGLANTAAARVGSTGMGSGTLGSNTKSELLSRIYNPAYKPIDARADSNKTHYTGRVLCKYRNSGQGLLKILE
jgi:hypothetical protein